MASNNERILDDFIVGTGKILEMFKDSHSINVPVDPRIDISTITEDDADPKFVNVEVLRAGISKTNRRRYSNNIVKEVREMIPGLHGFLGHPDPSKTGFEFREPQCIFVGAIIEQMADGLERVLGKAYLFKTSPLREWIPKSIAANNPMTVSINGSGDVVRNGDVLDVLHMTELQSIDWANPGTEGMGTSTAMSVVSELQNQNGGSNQMANEGMTTKDIISNVALTELKAWNPNAVSGIIKDVSLTEFQTTNPALYNQIKESGKITEMQLTVGGETKTVKIAEFQNTINALEMTITELKAADAKSKLENFKITEIGKLVPEKLRGQVSKRVSGTTEQEITASINNEIAYIREMGGSVNIPVGTTPPTSGEDMKAAFARTFGVKEATK